MISECVWNCDVCILYIVLMCTRLLSAHSTPHPMQANPITAEQTNQFVSIYRSSSLLYLAPSPPVPWYIGCAKGNAMKVYRQQLGIEFRIKWTVNININKLQMSAPSPTFLL
ncbi:hypothetical protein BDZ91DRAFT_29642 [Kalaharituber pfeilii]|nr:hypothetical protein BDZ91DRAFT_29642 [Kalaharituber pfeilii]